MGASQSLIVMTNPTIVIEMSLSATKAKSPQLTFSDLGDTRRNFRRVSRYLLLDFWFYFGQIIFVIQKISEPVSVSLSYNHQTHKVIPKALIWQGRLYGITKLGLHHTFRRGRTLYHVFSVTTSTLFFRLVLNTEDLHWRVEEIADGLTG